jgi:uncharacterized membrane protein YbhN (UPF0104 family)
MSSLLRSTASHRLTRTLRAVVPLVLLAALVAHLGTSPFERSLHVLSAGPIAVALLLGVVTTTAQALRWRTVAAGYGAADGLTRSRAVAECYRSALLNAVLPGGVLGDAVRAWRQRAPRERGLRTSAQAVIGERVAGTVVLLLAVAVVLLPLEPMMSGMALIGAVGAVGVAAPTLKRLNLRAQFAVWGWSALSLVSLVTKFGVAAIALGTVSGLTDIVTLALIVLAGMSIPIGIGGFGPREAVAAVAFAAVGLSADAGVATAAAYGMLAAVSALPGVLVMLLDLRRENRGQQLAQAEQDALTERIDIPAGLDVQPEPVHVLAEVNAEANGLPELVMAGALVKDDRLDEVEPATEHADLAGIIQLDLVGKARHDRFGAGAGGVRGIRTASRQIDLEADVLDELELERQSA